VERTLATFIKALRAAEVRCSTAETLDAFNAVELVGYRDRAFLKDTLSLVLPKTVEEKDAFETCFERFFTFDRFADGAAEFDRRHGRRDDVDDAGDQAREGNRQGGEGRGGGGGGGGGGGAAEGGDGEELGEGEMAAAQSPLGQLLTTGSRNDIAMAMAAAAREVELEKIAVFTQKGLYTRKIMDAMGLRDLQGEIGALGTSPLLAERRLSQWLKQRRDWLREQVRDHVERQFLLHADADGRKLREELLRKVKLSNVDHRNFHHVREVVFRMAKKLVSLHSRRRKVFKRGKLHVPRTLRHNMQYDGAIFDLHWKSVKVDRPKVFAICDVSGSVANYARFMLMFLYSLEEVMPRVRSFCFSSDLGEVTELFERNDLEDALAKALRDFGGGATDYGQSFLDFRSKVLPDVDNRSTIIILGDARNNYGEPHAEVLKEMHDRCRRLIWLNPEPPNTWYAGDSEMRRYGAYAHQVDECNSLAHLERVVGNLLKVVV
jgi:hypothetical protein